MKINPKEIFCELLSGLGMFAFLLPLVLLLDFTSCDKLVLYIKGIGNDLAILTILITLCYVLGILMDSIGLTLGYMVIDKVLGGQEPTAIDYQNYWKNVTTELSEFREQQWTYYSCFRNLSIVIIPAALLWFVLMIKNDNTSLAWVILISSALVEFFLIRSMKILLGLYYQITKYDLSADE